MLKRMVILALLGVSLASAKTYTFTVSEPTQAGRVQLKPGEYTVKAEGPQVQLVDPTGHRIDATAKVETTDHKFDQTAVFSSTMDGAPQIRAIELGGSKNRVVFE